jgi:hypothetical protein
MSEELDAQRIPSMVEFARLERKVDRLITALKAGAIGAWGNTQDVVVCE